MARIPPPGSRRDPFRRISPACQASGCPGRAPWPVVGDGVVGFAELSAANGLMMVVLSTHPDEFPALACGYSRHAGLAVIADALPGPVAETVGGFTTCFFYPGGFSPLLSQAGYPSAGHWARAI